MKKTRAEMIAFLKGADAAHRLKLKRLRFFTLASVTREVRRLKDDFDGIWERDGEVFALRRGIVTAKTSDILKNMFGRHDEALAILEADRSLTGLDRDRFRDFLAAHIEKEAARENLFRIFFGYGVSLSSLAKLRMPYLERYLPTTSRADAVQPEELRFYPDDIGNIRHILENFDLISENLEADTRLYRGFIRDFRGLYREKAGLRIIGYGEISTVMDVDKGSFIDENFQLKKVDSTRWIWKKMPPFPDMDQVREYGRVYREYREILVNDIGITVPPQMLSYFQESDRVTVYAGQERADPALIGNTLVKSLGEGDARTLFALVLWELLKVHRFNSSGGRVSVGLDGQLSNWVLAPGTPGAIAPGDSLIYIDTSSPLYRIEGKEQLNTDLFIKNAPSFLRLLIRIFFLKEVVGRYYDMRSVIVDLIANLHKEKRADLIDGFIDAANGFMNETGLSDKPLTREEIDKYYSGDAFIWRFFQFSRRVDKFIIEKILRRKYHYRLPEKIER